MVLTARDIRIVADLVDYQALTREQLQRLGHFRSKTRANAVLARLTRFGYLSRRVQPLTTGTMRPVYFPGPQASNLGGPMDLATRRRNVRQLSDLFLRHQLLINDVRISFSTHESLRIVRWLGDSELRALQNVVIADGYVEYVMHGKRYGAFIEVDCGTETLSRWESKTRSYTGFAASGRFAPVFGLRFFRVLVVCPSAARLANLRRTTGRITDKMFWFATAERLRGSVMDALWQRPAADDLQSLTTN